MGLMGLSLATRAAERAFDMPIVASPWVLYASCAVLAGIFLGYAAKALTHPAEVRAEWNHPVRIAFFPVMSISLLLLAAALLEPFPKLAHAIWLVGTVAQGALALSVISAWIGRRPFQTGQLTPAWFIPAVGNVIVPMAGARLSMPLRKSTGRVAMNTFTGRPWPSITTPPPAPPGSSASAALHRRRSRHG